MRQIAAGLLQNVFQVCKNLACLAFDIARADQIPINAVCYLSCNIKGIAHFGSMGIACGRVDTF